MADGGAIAQLDGAGRRYATAVESVVALAPTTLSVGDGELVAVTGPSGSGKTTLLHLLGLLLSPTEGTVVVDGVDAGRAGDARRDAIRRRVVGLVFQEAHLVEHLDVAQNVALWRPALDRARVDELLAALDVGELAARRPSELSGGQRQRVAVARALASRPRLVIADEPTASLDDESAALVLDALATHAADGGAAVVATHDPRVLERATRRLALERGRLVAEDEVAR